MSSAPSFYVVEGVLLAEYEHESGRSGSVLARGDVLVGSVAGPTRRPVDVHALTDLKLLAFSPSLSARRSPDVAGKLVLRLLEQQACEAELRCISHISRADERVVALLRALASRHGHRESDHSVLELALLHRHIGLLIGATRTTVSTALTEMASAGRVRLRPMGGYELPDPHVAGGAGRSGVDVGTRRSPAADGRPAEPSSR